MRPIFNALIRTHHITSRKKVAKLKQAATAQDVFVLIRYGGAPGVMYVEGHELGVVEWVSAVQVCTSVNRCVVWGRARSSEILLIRLPEFEVQRLPASLASSSSPARRPDL